MAATYPQIAGVEFDGELGAGAHSIVYRGKHHGARCAIKLPRAKARWSRWIYREAVALARVKHALLPTVLEVGEVDGLPYLVMELVEGKTLADQLADRGALDEESAATIASQLAEVLGAVHSTGLVHRDVKPRNIVMQPGSGALKLVDFGFATPMERVGGDTAGTQAYAAPEQLAPPGRVDARADLYAVGRVLFECLTGIRPSTAVALHGGEARDDLVARGVSPTLADIAAGLLREAASERYPDAHALQSELSRFNAGLPALGTKAYYSAGDGGSDDRGLFIGRGAELARIVGTCRAVHDGGALVLVRGARGAGKSRLLAAAARESRTFARVVSVASRQDDPPLSTLRRLLEAYCDEHVVGTQGANAFRSSIGNLASVARLIAPRRLNALLRGPAAVIDVGAGSDALVEGAAQMLLELARGHIGQQQGSLILTIDDAQWLDPASEDALIRVAHRVDEAPLTLILGSRAALAGSRFVSVRPARFVDVEIPKLSREDVRDLIAAYLGERTVDDALVGRIAAIAGGTPLGVLEVLGAFLDAGALRPHARGWIFDSARTDRVVLPQGALALLGRRLGELPPATLRVLEVAALIGTLFEDALVARVAQVSIDDLGYGLASARRAGLVEAEDSGRHQFVHDSLREMLVDDVPAAMTRQLHQRIAESLAIEAEPTFEDLCAAANHYVHGDSTNRPRAFRIARAAGEAALRRFDNETALRYFDQAKVIAESDDIALDTAFFRSIGEANLRLGFLNESLKAFETALALGEDPVTRASVIGRLSWVHQTRAEPEKAWSMLDRAFHTLGARMPIEDAASAASTSAHVARARLGRLFARPRRRDQRETDLLCELHYQNARLGLEYNKPARLVQSSLEARELSERGGSEAMKARASAFYALVMIALGRRVAGREEGARAKAAAEAVGDAPTIAFCVQLQAVSASFAGDIDESLVLFRECLDVHGPWLEMNEYSQNVSACDLLESLRGRARSAWQWVERAVERLRRSRTRPVVAEFLVHRARAALAAIGREVKDDPWLINQLASISPKEAGHGFHRLISWSPRVRYYLERGDLGADFEELVQAFNAEGHNARSVHLAVAEYYVCVAHGRIHQCLRAPIAMRRLQLPALRAAIEDLAACAKVPLLKAHRVLAEAYLAHFEGKTKRVARLLTEAEAVANEQSCPWVLYGVARLRAHMLKESGKAEAARDQARVAEVFALDHGAATRTRWIREEFGLADASDSPFVDTAQLSLLSSSSSSRSSSRTNRQLAALLQVARAPKRDLKAEQQAAVILDELISVLQAERGTIWYQPELGVPGTAVVRHRGSAVSVSVGADTPRGQLLRRVQGKGESWPAIDPVADVGGSSFFLSNPADDGSIFDRSRVMAVPLFLYDKATGALAIERGLDGPPFTADDRSLLELLSHQVPIALEIARLLFEREQVHASLQHGKKMEAMGQLAGGLAHDFNNMLAAMKVSLNAAQERALADEELTVELEIIGDAMQRAAQLTGQLLSFSRHQPVPIAVHDVNHLVVSLEPMLRRVAGQGINVIVKTSSAVDPVEVDQSSFDQALVNLLINARDAMPNGGTFSILTKNVTLIGGAAQRANLPEGDYVEVEASDNGEGMSAETLARIFEPFFTTKAAGRGTGLGLAMVYAFARNCGGGIEVSSELGVGTKFRIYLKRADRARTSRPARPTTTSSSVATVGGNDDLKREGPDTILVVDDDDLVRRSIAKILERNGYRVLAASGSSEALDVARQHGARIALIILDVLMPGLTGPELGRRLYDLNLPAKMLFVSGFSPESIQIEEAQVAAESLLQKPFSQAVLLERVRSLMHS
jgi:eukaryotic-like serine/threonine-protein kinase